MPRGCLGGDYAWGNHVSFLGVCSPGGSGETKGDSSRIKARRGAEGHPVPFTPSPSFLLFLWPAEDRAECVSAGSRLTRAAWVTWAGHVQPAPFLPQQLAHKQPGCCWRWRQRHVQARGWGTWPCPSQGKALAQHCLPPPHSGAASPQEIPSAPSLLQNMFLGSDFQ